MQYTDNRAALISGLISTYFFQPAVSATLKDTYSQVLNHLQHNLLSAADLARIQNALTFLTPVCSESQEARRVFLGVTPKTGSLLREASKLKDHPSSQGKEKPGVCRAFLCPEFIKPARSGHRAGGTFQQSFGSRDSARIANNEIATSHGLHSKSPSVYPVGSCRRCSVEWLCVRGA